MGWAVRESPRRGQRSESPSTRTVRLSGPSQRETDNLLVSVSRQKDFNNKLHEAVEFYMCICLQSAVRVYMCICLQSAVCVYMCDMTMLSAGCVSCEEELQHQENSQRLLSLGKGIHKRINCIFISPQTPPRPESDFIVFQCPARSPACIHHSYRSSVLHN